MTQRDDSNKIPEGEFHQRETKKTLEVEHQPGLQVNIQIGLRSSSEDPIEKKNDIATPDKKMKNTEPDHSKEDDQ